MYPFSSPYPTLNKYELYSDAAYFIPCAVVQNNCSQWSPINFDVREQNAFAGLSPPINFDMPDNSGRIQKKAPKTRDTIQNEEFNELQNNQESQEQSPDIRSHQKYGRNINSNIYHHMIKKITTDDYFKTLLNKILKQKDYQINSQQFYELMTRKLGRIKNYLSLNQMKKLFRGSNSRGTIIGFDQKDLKEFYQIFRILCRIYLKAEHLLFIFNRLKLKKKSKRCHVVGSRVISQLMK